MCCCGKCWQGLRMSLVNVDLFEKMKYSSLLKIKSHLLRKCVDLANIYQHIYQHLPTKCERFNVMQDRYRPRELCHSIHLLRFCIQRCSWIWGVATFALGCFRGAIPTLKVHVGKGSQTLTLITWVLKWPEVKTTRSQFRLTIISSFHLP